MLVCIVFLLFFFTHVWYCLLFEIAGYGVHMSCTQYVCMIRMITLERIELSLQRTYDCFNNTHDSSYRLPRRNVRLLQTTNAGCWLEVFVYFIDQLGCPLPNPRKIVK